MWHVFRPCGWGGGGAGLCSVWQEQHAGDHHPLKQRAFMKCTRHSRSARIQVRCAQLRLIGGRLDVQLLPLFKRIDAWPCGTRKMAWSQVYITPMPHPLTKEPLVFLMEHSVSSGDSLHSPCQTPTAPGIDRLFIAQCCHSITKDSIDEYKACMTLYTKHLIRNYGNRVYTGWCRIPII